MTISRGVKATIAMVIVVKGAVRCSLDAIVDDLMRVAVASIDSILRDVAAAKTHTRGLEGRHNRQGTTPRISSPRRRC